MTHLIMAAIRAAKEQEGLSEPLMVFAKSAEGNFLVARVDGCESRSLAMHPPSGTLGLVWSFPVVVCVVDINGNTFVLTRPGDDEDELAGSEPEVSTCLN
jgi:hypothetical protein